MADTQQAWIETLRRESGIRRAIILHGEILDVYPSPRNNQDYVPIQPIVCTTLRSKGFSDIILWDTFEGVKNIRPERWEELRKGMLSIPPKDKTADPKAKPYDMGDVALDEPQQSAQGSAPPNIDDFLPIVHFYLTHQPQSRIAFILDWSQYLFASNASLSEDDRKRLLMLSKSINNAPLSFKNLDEMKSPDNLLILITSKLETIPSVFYQGSACVKDIIVTGPAGQSEKPFWTENRRSGIWHTIRC